jgi:hypothetical protein
MDRRYTVKGCACGDAFCAGCDDEAWPAVGDTQYQRDRGRWATSYQRWVRRNNMRANGGG